GRVVVVVRDVEGVARLTRNSDVLAEGDSFELGRNVEGGDAVRVEGGDHVQEEVLAHGLRAEVRVAADPAHLEGPFEVDLVDLLDDGNRVVPQALAVALVPQELVVVDGEDLADGGLDRVQVVGELLEGAGPDVDLDEPQVLTGGRPPVL